MANSVLKPDENILREFDETTNELLNTLSSYSDQQLNRIPFEGSWTAGQVAEHLLKANSGAVRTVKGGTKSTERDAAENEKKLREVFLDFSTKFKSPDFIIPSNKPHHKENLLKKFKTVMHELRDLALDEDLTLTCTDFSLPGFGEMTRYEWLCFVMFHSKRHTLQMKNIYQRLLQS